MFWFRFRYLNQNLRFIDGSGYYTGIFNIIILTLKKIYIL